MTCYLKNMGPVLEKAGYGKLTKAQRLAIDKTIREVTGAQGKCPEVWAMLKEWLKEQSNEERLVQELKIKRVQ